MTVQNKGFVWCLMHTGEIDRSSSRGWTGYRRRIQSLQCQYQCRMSFIESIAHEPQLQVVAHADNSRFQSKMEEARQSDYTELVRRLEESLQNDHKILALLEDRNGQYRRMEELSFPSSGTGLLGCSWVTEILILLVAL